MMACVQAAGLLASPSSASLRFNIMADSSVRATTRQKLKKAAVALECTCIMLRLLW